MEVHMLSKDDLYNAIEYVKDNKKWFIIGTIVVLGLLFGKAEANPYDFPAPKSHITMEVHKNNAADSVEVFRCKSVYLCHLYVKTQEQRGATHFCKTITIKRNGRPIWFKRYN